MSRCLAILVLVAGTTSAFYFRKTEDPPAESHPPRLGMPARVPPSPAAQPPVRLTSFDQGDLLTESAELTNASYQADSSPLVPIRPVPIRQGAVRLARLRVAEEVPESPSQSGSEVEARIRELEATALWLREQLERMQRETPRYGPDMSGCVFAAGPVTERQVATSVPLQQGTTVGGLAFTAQAAKPIEGSIGYDIWGQPKLFLDNQRIRNGIKRLGFFGL